MDISVIQQSLESLIDWVISSDAEEVKNYVNNIRSENYRLSRREIAEIIVNKQSRNSGILGAITGFGGLMTLPATVPIDLVKSWKIQAFTIRCIAEIYGSNSQTTDLKTDIFLVLSNGSLEELKKFVIAESLNAVPKHALKTIHQLKNLAVKGTAKQVPKIMAKTITKYGGKAIVKYTMKGFSKHLIKALWKVGGRKIVEKAVQKSLGKAIPIFGAVIGGGMDWVATQSVGKLAIEYYENSVSDWVSEVFSLCAEQDEV